MKKKQIERKKDRCKCGELKCKGSRRCRKCLSKGKNIGLTRWK